MPRAKRTMSPGQEGPRKQRRTRADITKVVADAEWPRPKQPELVRPGPDTQPRRRLRGKTSVVKEHEVVRKDKKGRT